MPTSPAAKRALFAVVALLVVTAVVFTVVMTILIRNHKDEPPTISAYADGTALRVSPAKYCQPDLTKCETGPDAHLDVPQGQALLLTLPKEITDQYWRATVAYAHPDGSTSFTPADFRPGGPAELTVPSTPGSKLAGVEIAIPSRVVGPDGEIYARAYWSLRLN